MDRPRRINCCDDLTVSLRGVEQYVCTTVRDEDVRPRRGEKVVEEGEGEQEGGGGEEEVTCRGDHGDGGDGDGGGGGGGGDGGDGDGSSKREVATSSTSRIRSLSSWSSIQKATWPYLYRLLTVQRYFQALVFCQEGRVAEDLTAKLVQAGFPAACVSGHSNQVR